MQEGQFSYAGLIKLLALLLVLLLIGAGLWRIALDLFGRSHKVQKVGGALVIAIAAAYSLGVGMLVYWEFQEIVDLF